MVFNLQTALWAIDLVILIWLILVTWALARALANYNRLTRGATDRTLSEILTNFLEQDKLTKAELERVLAEISKLKEQAKNFIQKIGLVRFNPFSDTGGDQSFALALLDHKDNGIVITSLYARTGVRWYVKTIRGGKGIEHELSKEEKEALKQVKKVS
ncbi:MAG: hypothetical protein UV61_C0005G0033 [Candidatus Gottesmanbacteria bacterium GW2011_GWB1_43_11]|uniref:DUF4446 domain-containing protein n=1 Tax=Candidatus Gottesmanbacteria bacterium GW2011_GWB1_43_11 TaxID=1618446 RepID=A0A0G1CNE0_9BACT|nr:MAG: hypothetical protein UV04_C0010G0033 [Candidatus Gottesmanbacteria bacterium GW2011_GWA2_42_16]KKS55924.1 MAG: hypothetical protein UV17_C0005G0033 [Candidatus Gottesmanbacteria bacterium GW2011_GWA1_42_26]KKS81735.1 MAG: hypothetical protein UV55_C0009G0011 [Candidatus Gottesmanbacteria bacterium GW2011_GWC1_43_10]KKS87012.1 MAG: hypothetical protein UV61_C0005G0033 [Candidatus Gottesmanbacteria bacterium GW2011_GWB1_43_11]OGG07542.1 MAG: hypothetical protein A2699_04755 [Candidatus Go